MPKKICKAPGCGQVAGDGGYCDRHQDRRVQDGQERYRRKWQKRPWVKLYYTSRWKKMRLEKLRNDPICEKCGKDVAEEVHHTEPHRGDPVLFFCYEKLQSLCKSCHSRETARENAIRRGGRG